ncbi:MAG TPA: VOC family protein [Gaiellaceae bacterium]|nr:VOC family protein [Gaiellaceae bacterium]
MSGVVELALFTDRVAELRAFWEALLGRSPEAEWPEGAVFAAGAVKVLVHERAASEPGGPPNEDHVALGVPDLDAACEALRGQGRAFLVEPRAFPWGRSAYLRDPDGRLVELAETSSAA